MLQRSEMPPLAIALGLVLLLGSGLDRLLAGSERSSYPVVGLDVVDGVDRAYRGRYDQDPRFYELLDRMPAMRSQALATACRATGLRPVQADDAYVVRFKETYPGASFGASSQPVRSEQGVRVLVTVSARQFVLGVIDREATLAHEFIHGLMREHMGSGAYRALPVWLREGIAVWGSGQLAERCRNAIAAAFLQRRDPRAVVEAFAAPTGPADSYLRDALLFEYISRTYGAGAVRALVARLLAGDDPRRAFSRISGTSWYALRGRSERFVRDYVQQLVADSGLAALQAARRLYTLGERERALRLLEWAVVAHAGSILEAQGWYWIGRWRSELGRPLAAANAFVTVLRRFPGHLGLCNDSRRRLADCALQLTAAEALAGWTALTRNAAAGTVAAR